MTDTSTVPKYYKRQCILGARKSALRKVAKTERVLKSALREVAKTLTAPGGPVKVHLEKPLKLLPRPLRARKSAC